MILAPQAEAFPLVPADFFRRASVAEYLLAVELAAPRLNITADRAVAFGLMAAPRVRAGEVAGVRWLGPVPATAAPTSTPSSSRRSPGSCPATTAMPTSAR